MLRNYLKIAIRNLTKQKSLAFINIFGLSVGIACFSLFVLYAINEFSFDGFHKNAANIYLVMNGDGKPKPKSIEGFPFTPMPLGPAMKQELPGIENFVRYIQPYETFIKVNRQSLRDNIAYADPAFFNVFSARFKYGNSKEPLRDLNSIVLTESTAKKLFGNANAVGQSLQVKIENVFTTFIVSAITEDPPSNTMFPFSMLVSFGCFANTMEGRMGANEWEMNSYLTFVQLKPSSGLADNYKLLSDFQHKHFAQNQTQRGGYDLVPLREIHTNPSLLYIKVSPVDPKSIWILLSIATGVLLIACINFTTLSMARSAGRAREVGVRKVMGGTKKALAFQFLTESLLLAFFSTFTGYLVARLLLPWFNQLSGKELSFSFVQFPQLPFIILGLVLVVGLLSGTYPALVLAGFKASEILKTKFKIGGSNFFTKALVTSQFILSSGLIVAAVVIMQQLHFMQSRNPGFEKENIVQIKALGVAGTRNIFPVLKNELSANPQVISSSGTDNGLGEKEGMSSSSIVYQGKPILISQYYTDPDFMRTMGMHLISGRNFNPAIASDTLNSVVINEALMHEMGWTPENSVGRPLEGYKNFDVANPIVIGVVQDFNFRDLTHRVEPLLFHEFSSAGKYSNPWHFFVRIRPGDPSGAIAAIQAAWKKLAPEYPLKYSFLDEDIDRFYKAEGRLSKIVAWSGGIAISLACLGLLGLSAIAVVNRTKEIGIRKVLGASVSTIINLVSKEFLKLILVALLIATPLAWWLMSRWLQGYAFRINLNGWVFVLVSTSVICVAILTLLFQILKAASANPVNSLRSE